ncbi:hypothetical protein ACSSS7_003516 [Eimeria intestinalis]
MLSDAESSSGSEAAADLVDSLLGGGVPGSWREGGASPRPSEKARRRAAPSKVKTEGGPPSFFPEASSPLCDRAPEGLRLELKGLPLEVCPHGDGGEECLKLEPHQKLLRLSIEGDPDADPTGW